jgi:fatty-acyl-CoA synthase
MAALLAWQMNHCEAKVLITDREFAPCHEPRRCASCASSMAASSSSIDVCDSEYAGPGELLGTHEYEALLAATRHWPRLEGPADEWDAIAVSYTSGTTGDPKGVVTHHRGAYLNAVCNAATWTMPHFAALPLDPADVPLQRLVLPVDHRDAGRHPCLPAPGRGQARSWTRCATHGVDHYCAAPIVHNLV